MSQIQLNRDYLTFTTSKQNRLFHNSSAIFNNKIESFCQKRRKGILSQILNG